MTTTLETLRWHKFPVLNDGFVCLVDVMGDDSSITQAASVCYGKGTKHTSDDRTLIRYLMRHRHCYDANTEVLTENGFMLWSDIYKNHKLGMALPLLGIWDKKRNSLMYEKPEYLTCETVDCKMYQVNHGGVDLLVTPEHSMWVKQKEWKNDHMEWDSSFDLIPASKLGNSSMVRYSKLAPYTIPNDFDPLKIYPFHEFDDPKEMLRLFSFFIGDGFAGKTSANGISFHLIKKRKRLFIKEVCQGLGWEYRELKNKVITIRSPGISEFFRDQFYDKSGNKRIPSFMLSLNCEDSQAILDGFQASDGHIKRGAWSYSTSIESVAQNLQIIALHAGEAAHYYPKGSKGMWEVMFLSRMREPIINQSRQNTSMVHYSGNVYCAKTRTGVLIVRRNRKIVLSGNTTPFEMAEIKLLVRVPMDCWRQWIRHRTASVNEYSTRYSEAINSRQVTSRDEWRLQAGSNKQGSSGFLMPLSNSEGIADDLSRQEQELHEHSDRVYKHRLECGIAREQARKDLPLSTYTMAYWKIDLHNMFHFLGLRMDSHAQEEIRQYATIIGEQIVKPLFPLAWEAFEDYRLNGMFLTRLEVETIRRMNESKMLSGDASPDEWKDKKQCREQDECRNKLQKLGMIPNDV